MRILTNLPIRWIRRTTAVGLVPVLLAPIVAILVCVPETLNAGPEIRRDSSWEELPPLRGEQNVTLRLSEGGAVRGDVVAVQDHGIHINRITMATDRKRFPGGVDAMIPRASVKEIRVAKLRSDWRFVGTLVFGFFGGLFGHRLGAAEPSRIKNPTIRTAVSLVFLPLGAATLGYWAGRRKDRETTIITIVD